MFDDERKLYEDSIGTGRIIGIGADILFAYVIYMVARSVTRDEELSLWSGLFASLICTKIFLGIIPTGYANFVTQMRKKK